MGYFSNGSEGVDYECKYCSECHHQDLDGRGCAVWEAHMLYNYEQCNDEDSILHILIPRSKDDFNEKCRMFISSKIDRRK